MLRIVFPLGLGIALLLGGCESEQQIVSHREDLLAAAGFSVRPANTPARQEALRTLPPEHFVRQIHNGRLVYVFADPLVCNCLYLGDEAAYGRYQQEALSLRIANEQYMAAEMNENAAMNWGAWGPF